MSRFINPFTDVGFKKIFGQEIHKDLLIDFLNQLLAGEKEIVDIEYLDKELVPEYDGDRSTIFDIYCKTEKGEHIIVEMQNQMQEYFGDRALYYLSRSFARQGEKGAKWLFDLKAVYGIFFMNFSHEKVMPRKFRTDIILADKDTKQQFTDKLRMIFLQLPEFKVEEEECKTNFQRWIYILKHMESLNRMPFTRNAVFERLAKIMDIASLSKEERDKYDATIDAYRNHLAVMDFATKEATRKGMKEGMKEGIKEGIKEGQYSTRLETARNMKKDNMPVELISKYTGLTPEEIEKIKVD